MKIVLDYSTIVQVGSCDELYCDLSVYRENDQFLTILQNIKLVLLWRMMNRDRVFSTTGCTCSIGVSHNILMARIATKQYVSSFFYEIEPSQMDLCIFPTPIFLSILLKYLFRLCLELVKLLIVS